MTPNSINPFTAAVTAAVCRESFWDFVREFWGEVPGSGDLIPNWHMEFICGVMQEAAERVFRNLPKLEDVVINVSPGTSKSTICSILFQPWTWTRMAHARHISSTHTDALALDLANKSRYVVRSDKYRACFPEIVLRDDQDTKSYFANTKGGDRLTCTVGGKTPTGFHAHFLSMDDPIDPKKALSEVELKTAAEFATVVLPTRKVNKEVAVTFLIMQRLHSEDPTGVMLARAKKEGASKVRHVCLPAEVADNVSPPELKEKYVDGLMDPVRLPRAVLKDMRVSLGEYGYSGQFGQSPVPLEGGMFKLVYFNNRVKHAPYAAKRIRYWDRACLVGPTLVETANGPKRIDEIRAGDFVLTRQGFKRVKRAWLTKYVNELVTVRFTNGSVLTGTADHPVWTENRGWVNLSSILGSDYNVCLTQEEFSCEKEVGKALFLRASCTSANREPCTTRLADGIRTESGIGTIPSTGPSGVVFTVTSPLDTTFITRTRTPKTTRPGTLCASRGRSTTESTARSQSGTKRGKRTNCVRGMCKRRGRTPLTEAIPASSAVTILSLGGSTCPPGIAVSYAGNGTAWGKSPRTVSSATSTFGDDPGLYAAPRNAPWSTGKGFVQSVGRSLKSKSRTSCAAPAPVGLNGSGGTPVYDLEVEDAHEFFANGILVHNSTPDGGAYTAGVLLSRDREGNFYVEHVVHGQWDPTQRNNIMLATALRDRTRYGPKYAPRVIVESEGGSSGRDAWKGIVKKLAGFPVREDRVTGNKETRAEPWSAQLAGGNVYLVEDDTWDVQDYVQEHCAFPKGRFKDQVDSSTGAFNLMVGSPQAGTIHVLGGRPLRKKNPAHVILCSRDSLSGYVTDQQCLLVSIADHGVRGDGAPPNSLEKLGGVLNLSFANLDPADYQDRYREPVEPYGETIDGLVMSREQGKKVWAFLLRKRDPVPQVFVFQDDGEGQAASLALAFCDVLRWDRSVIYSPEDPEKLWSGPAENLYVYEMMKSARSLVVD